MIGFLASIQSIANTILGRIPSNNSTLVGRLDATMTSRAAASSAVNNAYYTNARGDKLDYLSLLMYGKGFRDPRRMPLWWLDVAQQFVGDGSGVNVDSVWTGGGIFKMGAAVASVATDDTYVTVLNASGRGFLAGFVGAQPSSSTLQTLRITVDGTAYTIAATNSARLFMGTFQQPYGVNGTTDGIGSMFPGSNLMCTTDDAYALTPNIVPFESTLLVEFKQATINPSATAPNRKCAALYRMHK